MPLASLAASQSPAALIATLVSWASPAVRTTGVESAWIGLIAALGGLVTSYQIDTQPGPTIVLIALTIFAVAALVGTLLRRTRSRRPHVDSI